MLEENLADQKRRHGLYAERFPLGSPPPVEPVLRTFDDGKIFKLTADEAKTAITGLVRESDAEFAKAEALADNNADKANFIETRAWAKLLMVRCAVAVGKPVPYDRAAIQRSFQIAVQLDPVSAERVCEQADSIIEMSETREKPSERDAQSAIGVYKRALALERRDDRRISARIFTLFEPYFLTPLKSDADAQAALSGAIRADPQNAFLQYIEAALLLAAPDTSAVPSARSTTVADALKLVEAANATPAFSSHLYTVRVPASLAVAYQHGCLQNKYTAQVTVHLATVFCSAAAADQQAGDIVLAERKLLAVVAMGKRLRTVPPIFPSDLGLIAIGYNKVLQKGYAALAKLYGASNRPDDARRATDAANAAAEDDKRLYDNYRLDADYGYVDYTAG